jgi:hypothetical protein
LPVLIGTTKQFRTLFFWVITQQFAVIYYPHFGTICQSNFQCSRGLIGCPKISVRNYHYSLHNNPEECSFQLLCAEAWNHRTEQFVRFLLNSMWEFLTNSCQVNLSFMKIGSVTVILYFEAKINFFPCFPYLLTDLGEIWCRRSTCNALLQL